MMYCTNECQANLKDYAVVFWW